MLEHEPYLEWISADLDGELPSHQQEQLKQHLHTCSMCAQLYQQLRQQSQAMQELSCTPPPHLHQEILQNLPPQVTTRRFHKILKFSVPLAACVCLAIALSTYSPDHLPAKAPRSNPVPAAFSALPQAYDVPAGDQVLLLSAPLSPDGQALLKGLPTTTLEETYVCCVTDPDTASQLTDLLDHSNQGYTQAAASAPDGSGDIAILWPIG